MRKNEKLLNAVNKFYLEMISLKTISKMWPPIFEKNTEYYEFEGIYLTICRDEKGFINEYDLFIAPCEFKEYASLNVKIDKSDNIDYKIDDYFLKQNSADSHTFSINEICDYLEMVLTFMKNLDYLIMNGLEKDGLNGVYKIAAFTTYLQIGLKHSTIDELQKVVKDSDKLIECKRDDITEFIRSNYKSDFKDEYLKDWEFIDAIYHIINDGAFFYKFKSFEKNSEKALFYIIPKALRIKGR